MKFKRGMKDLLEKKDKRENLLYEKVSTSNNFNFNIYKFLFQNKTQWKWFLLILKKIN